MYGIDRGAQLGGDLEGNGCRKLMENGMAIVDNIKEYILHCNNGGDLYATHEEIGQVCDYHVQLLLCLDGYISCMRTKRFHLTNEIVEQQKKYQKKNGNQLESWPVPTPPPS